MRLWNREQGARRRAREGRGDGSRSTGQGLMPLNVVLGELEDNEIVESALKCLKKALPLTFLVVDLPLLLPRVVGRDLEQALDIPQQGLRTRDRGVLGTLRHGDRRRGYLRVVEGLGRTFRARCRQRQILRHVRQI